MNIWVNQKINVSWDDVDDIVNSKKVKGWHKHFFNYFMNFFVINIDIINFTRKIKKRRKLISLIVECACK